jgi:hypothetical protein
MKIFFNGIKTSRQKMYIKNHFICQSGENTNSISQGQNNESIVIMLKSNVEKIHEKKVVN